MGNIHWALGNFLAHLCKFLSQNSFEENLTVFFQVMLQYLDKLQKEDMENLIKKHEFQRSLMKDVAKANEVML